MLISNKAKRELEIKLNYAKERYSELGAKIKILENEIAKIAKIEEQYAELQEAKAQLLNAVKNTQQFKTEYNETRDFLEEFRSENEAKWLEMEEMHKQNKAEEIV